VKPQRDFWTENAHEGGEVVNPKSAACNPRGKPQVVIFFRRWVDTRGIVGTEGLNHLRQHYPPRHAITVSLHGHALVLLIGHARKWTRTNTPIQTHTQNTYTYIQTHRLNEYAHKNTYTQTSLVTYISIYTQIYTYEYIYIYIHAFIHSYIHTHVLSYIRAYVRTYVLT
jgi:hypothetical protein